MPAFTLNATLTLTGPVLTAATAPGGYGLDAVFARDPMPPTEGNGHPLPGEHFILPASLVRGRLRQAWEELNSVFGPNEPKPFNIGALLGPDPVRGQQGSDPSDTNEPLRGRLRVEDFRACAETSEVRTRHRIAIDAQTGAADDQMLQLMEAPWGSGATVQFTGAIRCVAKDRTAAEELARQVEVGLRWVPQFGGERGLGFGANAGVSVSVQPSTGQTNPPSAQEADNATAWALVITPLAPFLLARHRTIENVFEGQDIIPGAAIKGALAELWREEAGAAPGTPVSQFGRTLHAELAEHLDALVFSHAFPAPKGQRTRPVVPPLSLARGGGLLRDLASVGGPGLLKGEAPTFDIDWKSRADVDRDFGWPDVPLPREPRLGTAIDREKNRARDEALFGKEAVIPTGYEWLARVDFSAVTDPAARQKVAEQLADLLAAGLDHLGKTHARARVEVLPAGSITPHVGQTLEPVDGQFIVTLQTPALLGWPEPLPAFPSVDSANWKTAYDEVWSELSGGALTCERFFARQTLAGGEYLWRRFQKKHGRPYNPWPLTEPGSVFVLQVANVREADAQTFLQRIATRGLPIPAWARTAFGLTGDPKTDWCFCPYLPENGYGEVALNLETHVRLAPKAGEFIPLQP
jgi:hypothetical protein